MSSILSFCQAMLPYVLGAAPIVILLRVVRIRQLHRLARSTTWQHEVGTGLFFLFLAGLASVTVLPQRNAMGHFQLDWHTGLARVNLVPFRIFADTLWGTDYVLINFWGNLAMFAPIGFFVPLLWRGHGLKSTALTGFCSSLFVELCQLPQDRGTDVDDLILNTLGAVLGYLAYALLKRRFPGFVQRCKLSARPQPGSGIDSAPADGMPSDSALAEAAETDNC